MRPPRSRFGWPLFVRTGAAISRVIPCPSRAAQSTGAPNAAEVGITHRMINDNYFGRRIASLDLLPDDHRCLTIPATEGGDDVDDQSGNTTGAGDRGGGPVSAEHGSREEVDLGRVRGSHRVQVLVAFCREQGIELTRSRPYRKNDQAWVEQKNGAVVRRMVGYGRLEGVPAAEALARLYSAARLFVNVFQPSFKLAEKTRHGGRVRKRYHAPETPCARLLALDAIPVATKDRLRAVLGTVDPLALLDEIRAVQHHLAALAAGATVHPMPERDADLDGFLRSLALAWRAGEVRPTHRARQRPPRHWRTRQDPFETSWPRIVQWLETEPHRTAKELFDRLRREQPGVFLPGQLRTLQRRVRDWRRLAARRLLFVGPTASPQDAFGSPIAVDARNEIATDLARLDQDAEATPPAGCSGGDHLERPGSRAPDPSPTRKARVRSF